jgi:DNA-binding NtrC family response regulator
VPGKILIVDDEVGVRFGVRDFLEAHGYDVDEAESAAAAQAAFRSHRPDAVLIDYRLPDGTALDLLPVFKTLDSDVPVILLTAHGSIDLAVQAIKDGAEHFLTKPVELPALLVILERLFAQNRTRRQQVARRARDARTAIDPFVGMSAAIRALADQAGRVAGALSPVLILGETGTGKGVLAAWLHRHGPRADEAFVDLNCASLSREFLETELFGHEKGAFTGAVASKPGLMEMAEGGTLFLDEIGDLHVEVQPKLLKVLEEKRFRRLGDVRDRRADVRLVAATHQDLGGLVREKRFRSDLYFRINTIPLAVPPLRARVDDIPTIARDLLARCAAELGRRDAALAADAERALCEYRWPGNIRELRNVLERALLLTDRRELRRADLRFEDAVVEQVTGDGAGSLAEMERRQIERALREEGGRVERAAARLQIPRSSLYHKIKQHGIVVSKL